MITGKDVVELAGCKAVKVFFLQADLSQGQRLEGVPIRFLYSCGASAAIGFPASSASGCGNDSFINASVSASADGVLIK